MNAEFHYDIIYLLASHAGYAQDAQIIAYASQYVDDNAKTFKITHPTDSSVEPFENYISQTMNIASPKEKLMRIYPFFHFLPGDPEKNTSQRKDFMGNWLGTTPNSALSQQIMQHCFATKDLYSIGIACHAYADTWAHQNFIGMASEFNTIPGAPSPLNIGHVQADTCPDIPSLIWRDKRLLSERVDNKARFIEAALCIFDFLAKSNGKTSDHALDQKKEKIHSQLNEIIVHGKVNEEAQKDRCAQYKRIIKDNLNDDAKDYDSSEWLHEAVHLSTIASFHEEVDKATGGGAVMDAIAQFAWDNWRDTQTWHSDEYTTTHWYRFQQAIISYQKMVKTLLKEEKRYQFWMLKEEYAKKEMKW